MYDVCTPCTYQVHVVHNERLGNLNVQDCEYDDKQLAAIFIGITSKMHLSNRVSW